MNAFKDYIFPKDIGKTHLRILTKYFVMQLGGVS